MKRERVGIVGAGVSGLLACKYAVERGYHPIVFEASDCTGGIWARTMASTKIQSPTFMYKFSDFPWPSDVVDVHPDHSQVLRYIRAYEKQFDLTKYIRFNCRVLGVELNGASNEDLMQWEVWGGTGHAFERQGRWHIVTVDGERSTKQVFEVEFLVLCIGRFSGLPNLPDFRHGEGPDVFEGKVMHAMEYSHMDANEAIQLVKGRRVVIIGYQKAALNLAAECARVNGSSLPCTMVVRDPQWVIPGFSIWWGWNLIFLYLTRFAELMVHKPGEGMLLSLLAAFLIPLRWIRCKFVESYLLSTLPLKKYGMVPNQSFEHSISTCQIAILPNGFYKLVEDAKIILRRFETFKFCKKGLSVGEKSDLVEADLVIFATGYRGGEKIKNMFVSPLFQKMLAGTKSNTINLYRDSIHPRIPQAAIVGYSESYSNLYTSEMRIKWLFKFLDGGFRLPSIRKIEEDMEKWEKFLRDYGGHRFYRSCIGALHIWYNDQLLKDMGVTHLRKRNWFEELFTPYMADDYAYLDMQRSP